MERAPTNYGLPIGIIMMDTAFPRLPGDVGNATTFDFPVVYRVLKDVDPVAVLSSRDLSYLDEVTSVARALEAEGVRAIVGGCGFLATFQEELRTRLRTPVFTSTLMFVPVIHRALGPREKVGIITANSRWLTEKHFEAVGWSPHSVPVAIASMEEISSVTAPSFEDEIVDLAETLVADHPDVGALVLECTNLPPFAHGIQKAIRLPVFDVVVMTNMVFDMVVRRRYKGFL